MTIEWSGILIHHSATRDDGRKNSDAIAHYHTTKDDPRTKIKEGQGWSAIGYHFLVELIGNRHEVVYGRPLTRPGAHCPGRNKIDVGICVVGDYSKEPPSDDALDCLADLCVKLIVDWPRMRDEHCINGHKSFKATECPGAMFPIDELRDLVRERLSE